MAWPCNAGGRSVARVAALLLTVIVAWMGLIDPAFASAPEVDSMAATHAYDDHGHAAASGSTTSERSPLGCRDCDTTSDAIDRSSRGASVRADGTDSGQAPAYDHLVLVVQAAASADATCERDQAASGDLRALSAASVAAKSADEFVDLASTARRRPGDFFVTGTRGGIDIKVLIRNDQIWTGYPTNVPRTAP